MVLLESEKSPYAMAVEIGERLKQARLNKNLSQEEVAQQAGLTRRSVANAENGYVLLSNLIAILDALEMTSQINNFLPKQPISPIQLLKLQGKSRQRASSNIRDAKQKNNEEDLEW